MLPVEPRTIDEMKIVAEIFAQSGLFRDATSMAQAFVKILAGRELGFGAFASMNGIHIINGKTVLGANLIAAAIKRHTSPRYDYRVVEHTDRECVLHFYRDGERIGESSFTMKDAQAAGLLGKGGSSWERFPRNMLFARALSNGARWFCPDVFGGAVYTPDEMGAEVDEDGNAILADTPTVPALPLVDEQRREERRIATKAPKTTTAASQPPAPAAATPDEVEPTARPGEGQNVPSPVAAYDPTTDTRPLTPRTWEQLQAWLMHWPLHTFSNSYAAVNAMRAALVEAGLIEDKKIAWSALYDKQIPVFEVFRAIEAHYTRTEPAQSADMPKAS